jgi:hypothetical protein
MPSAMSLLRRYRGAWQHVHNLEYDLEQARKQRKRSSSRVLMDALHDAREMVKNVEKEVDNFMRQNSND